MNKYPNSILLEETKDPGSLPEDEMDFGPQTTSIEKFLRDA